MTVRDLKDAINACTTADDDDLPVEVVLQTGVLCARYYTNKFDMRVQKHDKLTDAGITPIRVLEIVI